jgi:hypothetical protein
MSFIFDISRNTLLLLLKKYQQSKSSIFVRKI